MEDVIQAAFQLFIRPRGHPYLLKELEAAINQLKDAQQDDDEIDKASEREPKIELPAFPVGADEALRDLLTAWFNAGYQAGRYDKRTLG